MAKLDVIPAHAHRPPISESESYLPSELEREICGIAVYNFPSCVPSLILTARRFKIWFEPELYRIIRSEPGRVIPPLDGSQLNEAGKPYIALDIPRILSFGHHVQHILLQKRRSSEIADILKCCPNVFDLAIWGTRVDCPSLFPILERLHLRKLSFDPTYFFLHVSMDTGFPFDQPLFHKLAHLQIMNPRSGWWKWQQLALLPKLTHLCLGNKVEDQLVDQLLEECRNLELFVMFSDAKLADVEQLEPTIPAKDVRFVILGAFADSVGEWEKGARGEGSFWQKAQGIKDERVCKRLAHDRIGITSVLVE